MRKIAALSLLVFLAMGCKSDPQPAQYQYPQGVQVPGQVPQAVPGQVPQAVPGQVPQAVPGQVPQAVPGQLPQAVPGQAPAPKIEGTLGRFPGMPATLWMPGEPLPPSPGTGAATPQELIKTITDGFNSSNTAAVISMFPSEDQLTAVLKCSGDKNPFQETAKAKRDYAVRMYHAWKNKETRAMGEVKQGPQVMTMSRGSERMGCVSTDDLTIQRYSYPKTITRAGVPQAPEEHTVILLHIGTLKRWFIVDD